MPAHDVHRFVNSLATKLAARTRHVSVFTAAGASKACGLPDIKTLEKEVLEALPSPQTEQFRAQLEGRHLESALSRIRRIAALLGQSDKVDGLTASDASALDAAVCAAIVKAIGVERASLDPVLHFASWAARADYTRPLELFTVNYDLLLETALERRRVPYFDGFVGSIEAPFRTDLVEARPGEDDFLPSFFVRLWKLHGSANWSWRDGDVREVVRIGGPAPAADLAAIYPSDAKYDDSRRVPFVVLQDRFRRALLEPESLTLISGYSWGDEHLNELIFDAALRRPRSEVVAFSYSDIPPALAKRASEIPNLQALGSKEAIIGGIREVWGAPSDDSDLPGVWHGDHFVLGDFARLAVFLSRSGAPINEALGANDVD